jgi:hypothetical protein
MKCLQQNGYPNLLSMGVQPVSDVGFFTSTCNVGHVTYTVIQSEQFELLSELAICAIIDGYYRESVASFAASLERFYEFYVRIVCASRGIESATLDKVWRSILRLSERQLGAFVATYMLENSVIPRLLPEGTIAFRNLVIHQGKFPTREESVSFAQAVATVVSPILDDLKSDRYAVPRRDRMFEVLNERRARANPPSGATVSTTGSGSVFSLTTASSGPIDIVAVMAERAARPDFAKIFESRAILEAAARTLEEAAARSQRAP